MSDAWTRAVEAKRARSAAARKAAATRKARNTPPPCTATHRGYTCQRHVQGYHVSEGPRHHVEWRIGS